MNTIPTMLTIRETASKTGLSYDHISKLCKRGEITYVRAGNKYLINLEKFIDYLNSGQQSERQEVENMWQQGRR